MKRINVWYAPKQKLLWFKTFLCRSHVWQNFLSLRFGPKCSQPVKLQDYFICNIAWIKWWVILFFAFRQKNKLSAIVITGLKESESIRLQDSFISSTHWIKWKNTLTFLRIERYLRKARTKTVLAWLLEKSDCRILCSVISPESTAGSIWFFPWRQKSRKRKGGIETKILFGPTWLRMSLKQLD